MSEVGVEEGMSGEEFGRVVRGGKQSVSLGRGREVEEGVGGHGDCVGDGQDVVRSDEGGEGDVDRVGGENESVDGKGVLNGHGVVHGGMGMDGTQYNTGTVNFQAFGDEYGKRDDVFDGEDATARADQELDGTRLPSENVGEGEGVDRGTGRAIAGEPSLRGPSESVEQVPDSKPNGISPDQALPSEFQINPHALQIRQNPATGRGVYAARDFPSYGTVMERSPVLVLTKEEWEKGGLNEGVLGGYGFNWTGGGMAIGLGIASMFNHSSTPNVSFSRQAPTTKNPDIRPAILFRTARPIKAGEELCICYSADESKLWFSPSYGEAGGDGQAGPSRLREGLAGEAEEESLPGGPGFSDGYEAEVTAARAERRSRKLEWKAEKREQNGGQKRGKRREAVIPEAETRGKSSPRRDETDRTQLSSLGEDTRTDRAKLEPRSIAQDGEANATDTGSDYHGRHVQGRPSHVEPAVEPDAEVSTAVDEPKLEQDYDAALAALGLVDMLPLTSEAVRAEEQMMTDEMVSGYGEKPWRDIKRIRGPVEEMESDPDATVDLWVLVAEGGRLTSTVLKWLNSTSLPLDKPKHIQRVNRQVMDGAATSSFRSLIALGAVTDCDSAAIQADLRDHDADISSCEIVVMPAPKEPASSSAELAARSHLWPTTVVQKRAHMGDVPWTAARRAWVRAGLARVIGLARSAKEVGELPIAAHVTCPAEGANLVDPSYVEPTANMRAQACDSRLSTGYPLKHAAMGCIAQIAHLRTVPPFSTQLSATNGADYLLTSLSLFITHEPCVMCAMALVHSRVKEVFYISPTSTGGGAMGTVFSVHGYPGLNHRIDVYACGLLVGEEERAELALPESTNV